MGNRVTENKKRSNRAFGLVIRCHLAGGGCRLPDSDCPDVRSPELCDRHRCTATTRRGTRCLNSATYPEQRSCGIHVEAVNPAMNARIGVGNHGEVLAVYLDDHDALLIARELAQRFGAHLACNCGRERLAGDGSCPRCAEEDAS